MTTSTDAVPFELSGVAETLASGDGFWRSCSGCHETEDGHPVGHYPFSAILNCDLGGGCSECGGIGAVWDDTDYGEMADAWDAQEIAREQAEAQAPIYQVMVGDKWVDSTEAEYAAVSNDKRIVYADRLAPTAVQAAQAEGVPREVIAALDRMCTPLDPSVLAGATASADAHSMKVIRDYVLGHGKSGWISIGERMPEPDEPVLVHNGRWTGVGAWMSDEHLEDIERWQDEQREFIEMSGPAVTHWMPLPASPVEGQ